MARTSKPWYWEARKCWATTLNGKRYTAPKTVASEHEAWAWHKSIVEGSLRATVGKRSVADVCELYLEWDEKRVNAEQRDAQSHDLIVIKLSRVCATVVAGVKVGKLPATSIRGQHLKSMLLEWRGEKKKDGKRLSVNYVRDLASTFKAVFNWAVGQDPLLVPSYPFAKTPLPKAPKPASRFATRKEAAQWLRFLWRKGLRDFALLQRCLVHSGARPSELTRATWDEIDWDGWKDKVGHSGAIVTRTEWKSARKTGEERRVYLPASLRRSLRRRMEGLPDPDSQPIFVSPRHQPWTASNLATTTQRFVKEAIDAGVPLKSSGPDRLICYRWRHTAASKLLMDGVPIAVVGKLLGTSAKMISEVYGHLLDESLADAASKL